MKVILSHDVDHMTVWDHYRDLILPKFVVRSALEFGMGKIGMAELGSRARELAGNKWQNIAEVIDFHRAENIRSTFFVGVANGVGLNYALHHAEHWIPYIRDQGFEVGIHGIAFDSAAGIQAEYDRFRAILGHASFGIRMHYLRRDADTLAHLAAAGYSYDATDIGFKDPYRIGPMWEFPLQIMDGWVVNADKRYQVRNLAQCKDYTKAQIEKAQQANLAYLSILFHDRYYSRAFRTWIEWYQWLVGYLKGLGCEFVVHEQAVGMLTGHESKLG